MCIVYVYLSSIAPIIETIASCIFSFRSIVGDSRLFAKKSWEKLQKKKKKILNHCSSILTENYTILERETNEQFARGNSTNTIFIWDERCTR